MWISIWSNPEIRKFKEKKNQKKKVEKKKAALYFWDGLFFYGFSMAGSWFIEQKLSIF